MNPASPQPKTIAGGVSPADAAEWVQVLRGAGLVGSGAPRLVALTGGVSSEIVLVEDEGRRFVVKRALAKLRVRDDWFADTGRSGVEQAYLRVAEALAPGCVPRVLFADRMAGWFAMEYLGDGFVNWKEELLAGRADAVAARRAGEVMGVIHRETWGDAAIAAEFATGRNFYALRIEPYLETAARRVPDLAGPLVDEAARLQGTALALVHGDFSPKNVLVTAERFVLVDAEVGWFGDPVFDAAFLLNHLFLKALRQAQAPERVLELARVFWTVYVGTLRVGGSEEGVIGEGEVISGDGGKAAAAGSGAGLISGARKAEQRSSPTANEQAGWKPAPQRNARGVRLDAGFEGRTVRLLLCLMLARVHGKSPVEYLPEPEKQRGVVEFVRAHLFDPPARLADLMAAWREALRHL